MYYFDSYIHSQLILCIGALIKHKQGEGRGGMGGWVGGLEKVRIMNESNTAMLVGSNQTNKFPYHTFAFALWGYA